MADRQEISTEISWSAGGAAVLTSALGVQVTVRSDKPFPPGAPVAGTLAGTHGFTLKVATSRRVAEGQWEVRGRLLTATAPVLAAFSAAALPR